MRSARCIAPAQPTATSMDHSLSAAGVPNAGMQPRFSPAAPFANQSDDRGSMRVRRG